MAGFGAFFTYPFFFTTGRRKDEADVKYFNFIIKCTNYIYIKYIYLLQNTGFFVTERSTR